MTIDDACSDRTGICKPVGRLLALLGAAVFVTAYFVLPGYNHPKPVKDDNTKYEVKSGADTNYGAYVGLGAMAAGTIFTVAAYARRRE